MPQPASIKRIYEAADQLHNMPEGKGINSPVFHKCVVNYLNKNMSYGEAAKRCVGGLGEKAFNPSHRKNKISHYRKD